MENLEIVSVTKDNLENEHICCAISNNKDCQVVSKKQWMKKQFDDGLVFLKGNVRGKCFIEYIPAESAWIPIDAEEYMYIDCMWISGKYKGQGYSSQLLEACIQDAKKKGKQGLVVLSSKKKRGFLSDYSYFTYKGFVLADSVAPYFELLYLPFGEKSIKPQFKQYLKEDSQSIYPKEFAIYYTSQCPFTAKYVPILQGVAERKGIHLECIHIDSKETAQHAPSPFTTFGLFYKGKLLTHEILSEKKFETMIDQVLEVNK